MANTQRRVESLRRAVGKEQVDAVLITSFTNVTYLTGFTGDDSYLLVTRQGQVLLSDARYTTQLEDECPDLELEIRQVGVTMLELLAKVLRKAKVGSLAVEAESMTLALHDQIRDKLPKLRIAPVSGVVEALRLIKDKTEIDSIRRAVRIAERAFDVVRASLRLEATEKQVADELDHQIRLFGGRRCSFPPIVARGPRAALPHANPTDLCVGDSDFILIDWGALGGLYLSDLTRVLVTGRISPKLERIYGVVLKAQRQAIAAIKPGARMCDVDAAARRVIAKAGYGKQFGHGLGHGIGLEVHEAPRLAAKQEAPLKAGMVVTVEPGIYLPGWGGVRIEDDILVTRTGHEELSTVAKDLDDCVVAP